MGLYGQAFTLISQNCLHLGWAVQKYPQKSPTFLANAALGQVTVFQEVMDVSGATTGPVTPGNYLPLVSGLKGASTYREGYLFVVDQNLAPSAVFDYPDPNANFSRSPSGIRVTPTGGGVELWVLDYHAVFGKNAGVRRAEVGAMPAVVTWFNGLTNPQVTRMVIGGDWNLGSGDVGFGALTGAGFTVVPNFDTSLKRNGGLSQPYDHFAYHTADTGVGAVAIVNPAGGNAWWRANISDHLGIQGTVN